MPYDMVIEQVRALPESLLPAVSAFIKWLTAEQNISLVKPAANESKEPFFALAGKIHLAPITKTNIYKHMVP